MQFSVRERPSETSNRLTIWLGALGTLAAAAMLLPGLNDFSMWFDEVRMVLASMAWNPLNLATYTFRPGHPPLYFMLLSGWMVGAGRSDFSLRLFSTLTAIITAAVIIRAGKDVTRSLFPGVAGAVLFAAMGLVRYYVHETHNYALFMLTCMVLLFFYERWWKHPAGRVYQVGSVLATAAVMYTHYYGAFFILALNVFVVIAGWRRARDILRWIGLEAAAAVLYLPWTGVIVFLARRITEKINLPRGNRILSAESTRLSTIVEMINTLFSDQLILYATIAILCAVGLVLLLRSHPGQVRRTLMPVLLFAVLVVGSLVIVLSVNLIYKTFTTRRVIFVLPALALLIGTMLAGLPRLVREGVLIAAVGLILAAGVSHFVPGDWYFRRMVATIAADYQPGDLILLQMPDDTLPGIPLAYYSQELLPADTAILTLNDISLDTPDGEADFANRVFEPYVLARDRFWVISAIDPKYGEPSLDWVTRIEGRQFTQADTSQIGLFRVSLFTAPPLTRGVMRDGIDLSQRLELPRTFGDNQFELDRVQINRIVAQPGDTIEIWLDWRTLKLSDQDYAIFVHLLRGDGLILQNDSDAAVMLHPLPTTLWPPTLIIYDTHSLVIPPDMRPGQYSLVVGMYSRASGARLPISSPTDRAGGLVLDTINITGR